MSYAIDLSPRQSSRTLEQAVRHQARVVLQPRVWPEEERLVCRIEAAETPRNGRRGHAILVLKCLRSEQDAEDAPPRVQPLEKCQQLVGTYSDIVLKLGDARYLFSADVLEVAAVAGEDHARICITRPEILQSAQRRRYWRFRPARSAQVELRWSRDDGTMNGGVAWLCNVSAEGLACRTEARLSDQLCIGDEVKAEFALAPGDPHRFALDAVICNKMPGGSEEKLVLGLQFMTGPGYESSSRAADALRQQLLTRYPAPADATEEADA
jgi:hypothetical protein